MQTLFLLDALEFLRCRILELAKIHFHVQEKRLSFNLKLTSGKPEPFKQ